MYEDSEDVSDIDEDFSNALALLHSTENDSAEKLRKILDTSIGKRYGFDKTLMARMPWRFLQNTKTRGKSFTNERMETSRKKGNATKIHATCGSPPPAANNTLEINWKSMKMFNVNVEDYNEKGDIPRISIPDEGSGDGLLCKVFELPLGNNLIVYSRKHIVDGYSFLLLIIKFIVFF